MESIRNQILSSCYPIPSSSGADELHIVLNRHFSNFEQTWNLSLLPVFWLSKQLWEPGTIFVKLSLYSGFFGNEIFVIASIFSSRVLYCSPDNEVRISGMVHSCSFELIYFYIVAGSLVPRNRPQHSRFAGLIAHSHRFSSLCELLS
jgi:hypothetical protein